MIFRIVEDFEGTGGYSAGEVSYAELPSEALARMALAGDPEALRHLALTASGFDESLHPRDPDGKFTDGDSGDTGGSPDGGGETAATFITRHGEDIPTGDAAAEHTRVAIGAAASYAENASDPYRHFDDFAGYASGLEQEVDPETGIEAYRAPDEWEPGSVAALSEAASSWQATFVQSAEIQAAADALMGHDPGREFDEVSAAHAREILTAMTGNGPEGAAAAGSFVSESAADIPGIGMQSFSKTELVRGVDDPTGEIVDVFREAQANDSKVAWSMASFVVGGTLGEERMAIVGDSIPYFDYETGDQVFQDGDDNAHATALLYTKEDRSGTTGSAPVLIRVAGEGLVVDSVYEAIVGGEFVVEEIRDATPGERKAWDPHGPPPDHPDLTPITVIDLRQVANVKLPEGVSTR